MRARLVIAGLCFLAAACLMACTVSAASSVPSVQVDIEENGTIIDFYERYFVFKTNGTISIHNPTSTDLHSIDLPLDLTTLKMNLESEDGISYGQDQIHLRFLGANSTVSGSFQIVGISSVDRLASQQGVLMAALEQQQMRINAHSVGTLKKAPLEDPEKGGDPNTRLITGKYHNPTDFIYHIEGATVIKTGGMDVNEELNQWHFEREDELLRPGHTWEIDFLDENAHRGEVYWLSGDMYIQNIEFNASGNVTVLTQDEMYTIKENATNVTQNLTKKASFLSDTVFLRKKVDKQSVTPGEEMQVTLLASNFAPQQIEGATLEDSLPRGFRVTESRYAKVGNDTIQWANLSLNAQETRRITYSVRCVDNDTVGLDHLEPAQLSYDGKEVYSKSHSFVRSYMPEKNLFVQKTLDFVSDDEVKVTITLRNTGQTKLKHLVLREYLEGSEFKEITKEFSKKGRWKINAINRSDSWEVSYVTDRVNVHNTFPTIYGVEEKSVMRTVILSNEVSSTYSPADLHLIEIGGIIIVLLTGIIFLVPKERLVSSLKTIGSGMRSNGGSGARTGSAPVSEPAVKQARQAMSAQETQPSDSSGTGEDTTPSSDNQATKRHEQREKEIEETEEHIKQVKNKVDQG